MSIDRISVPPGGVVEMVRHEGACMLAGVRCEK